MDADDRGGMDRRLNPKLSIGIENFALRADESPLRQRTLSGLNPDIENESKSYVNINAISFIFNRQHAVQKVVRLFWIKVSNDTYPVKSRRLLSAAFLILVSII
jgi:hypothetical protein